MSAQWLAQLPGSVLAIAGEVHAASHAASHLADTKHPGWRPRSIRATTRVMSGNASAQYPAQLPGNCRESAGQCPGNISCGVPRIIHAASNESSGCLPGNCRVVSGQCPGNVHAMSANPISQCPCPVRELTVAASTTAHNPKTSRGLRHRYGSSRPRVAPKTPRPLGRRPRTTHRIAAPRCRAEI